MKTHLLSFMISLLLAVGISVAQAQPVVTVKMDSVRGCPGEIVKIPVQIHGVSDLGLSTLTFRFEFDTAMLEPVLLTWDPVRNQGFPIVSEWNTEFLNRGSFAMNYFYSTGSTQSSLMITWIDRMFGQEPFTLEDGVALFNLNIRIKQTLIEPTVIGLTLADISYYQAGRNRPYTVNREHGHVLAKSVL